MDSKEREYSLSTTAVMPCLSSHEATQRAHLDPNEFIRLGLKYGQLIRITTKAWVCLCSAWPGRWNTTCADLLVKKDGWEDGGEGTQCRLEVLPNEQMVTVYVDVILKKEAVNELGLDSTSERLHFVIFNLLIGLYIAEGFHIHAHMLPLGKLVGVHEIIVKSCAPVNRGGLISRKTDVIVERVISEPRYTQINQFRTLRLGGVAKHLEDVVSRIKLSQMKNVCFYNPTTSLPQPVPRVFLHWNFLIRGPPGNGKTEFVKIVARECDAFLYQVLPADCTGSRLGQMGDKLKAILREAAQLKREGLSIVLFDDIEVFCPREYQSRTATVQQERALALFTNVLDELSEMDHIIVFATTSRTSSLVPALRRPGRFDKEVLLGLPTEVQRLDILRTLTSTVTIDTTCDLGDLASATPGFSGSDLKLIINKARRKAHKEKNTSVKPSHLEWALNQAQPSSLKNSPFAVQFKPVAWSDIGGLERVKKDVREAVELPLQHPEAFLRLGLARPRGVLLYGPPGCAKTTLVRAAATSAHVTFLSVSCAELYSAYVGDSEKKMVEVFGQARAAAPCILFLDEVDVLVGQRGGREEEGAQDRVLTTLLSEMDGVGLRMDDSSQAAQNEGGTSVHGDQVLVVMATNRPDVLDSALTRPGRVDRVIYVPPPDQEGRRAILQIYTSVMPTAEDVDIQSLVQQTEGFTGADLENLCREAALHALSIDGLDVCVVTQKHFEAVLKTLTPSVTQAEVERYVNMRLGQTRTKLKYPVQQCA